MNAYDLKESTLEDPTWYAWSQRPRVRLAERVVRRAIVLHKGVNPERGNKAHTQIRVLLLDENEQVDGKPGEEVETYSSNILSRWETVEHQVRAANHQEFLLKYAREQLARERRALEQEIREHEFDLVNDFRVEDGTDRVSVPFHVIRQLLKGHTR